jgi:hypothetical protein
VDYSPAAFPCLFRALGYDADRDGFTIVDCGGTPNMPLFIRICRAAQVPCLAVHDRDALPGRRPGHAQRILNAQIADLAGRAGAIELAPDFEAVARLRGHQHKPARAFERFSRTGRDDVLPTLRSAVERIVALARG